jgi:hypothetical protein
MGEERRVQCNYKSAVLIADFHARSVRGVLGELLPWNFDKQWLSCIFQADPVVVSFNGILIRIQDVLCENIYFLLALMVQHISLKPGRLFLISVRA